MINDGETLVIEKCRAILTPCGKCLELLTQVDEKNCDAQVFVSNEFILKLKDLFLYNWKNIKDNYSK